MKYVSFFSGIGSLEVALHERFPKAKCIGFSEINKDSIQVYEKHFPGVPNLGDITKIKELPSVPDLILAGFPCTNLSRISSISGNRTGLDGPQSGLFKDLMRLVKWSIQRNPKIHVIFENNVGMYKEHLEQITRWLQKIIPRQIHVTKLDAGMFGMQHRERYFFTTFPVEQPTPKKVSWDSVLDPLGTKFDELSNKAIKGYNAFIKTTQSNGTTIQAIKKNGQMTFVRIKSPYKSRWEYVAQWHSTLMQKSRTITTSSRSLVICDYRKGLIIRRLSTREVERLFGYPKGYVGNVSIYKAVVMLGNSIDVNCARHVVKHLPWKS